MKLSTSLLKFRMACSTGGGLVVASAEKWGHNMEVQEVHIVEVLVPMRNLCDSPNYGCKHNHVVNSSIGFYSPS